LEEWVAKNSAYEPPLRQRQFQPALAGETRVLIVGAADTCCSSIPLLASQCQGADVARAVAQLLREQGIEVISDSMFIRENMCAVKRLCLVCAHTLRERMEEALDGYHQRLVNLLKPDFILVLSKEAQSVYAAVGGARIVVAFWPNPMSHQEVDVAFGRLAGGVATIFAHIGQEIDVERELYERLKVINIKVPRKEREEAVAGKTVLPGPAGTKNLAKPVKERKKAKGADG
jgi:hypothetical protein